MPATNGRGAYHSATLVWRWTSDGLMSLSLAHRLPAGWVPSWVAVVPALESRPDWIPEGARMYALADGDEAWVW